MHFDSLALQDCYFLDSQWLCDMFAHVISTKYNSKHITFDTLHDHSDQPSIVVYVARPGRDCCALQKSDIL